MREREVKEEISGGRSRDVDGVVQGLQAIEKTFILTVKWECPRVGHR